MYTKIKENLFYALDTYVLVLHVKATQKRSQDSFRIHRYSRQMSSVLKCMKN